MRSPASVFACCLPGPVLRASRALRPVRVPVHQGSPSSARPRAPSRRPAGQTTGQGRVDATRLRTRRAGVGAVRAVGWRRCRDRSPACRGCDRVRSRPPPWRRPGHSASRSWRRGLLPVSGCAGWRRAGPRAGSVTTVFRHRRRAMVHRCGHCAGWPPAPAARRRARGRCTPAAHRSSATRHCCRPGGRRCARAGRSAPRRRPVWRCGAAPVRATPSGCPCGRNAGPRARPVRPRRPCLRSGGAAGRRSAGRPAPLRRHRPARGPAPFPGRARR